MARANFVKKARKDNPVVKKGESYYWWKFAFGSKQYSKHQPSRSQLTQSGFLSSLYNLQDTLSFDVDDLEGSRDSLVSELEQLRDECQESLDNMPEHLQDSSASGEILRERIDQLEEWISNLESANIDLRSGIQDILENGDLDDVDKEGAIEELKDMKVNELEDCDTF